MLPKHHVHGQQGMLGVNTPGATNGHSATE
jgi:hypothetical protein